jgi:guanylate kinase
MLNSQSMINEKISNPLLFCFIGPGASGKSSICTSLAADKDLPVHLSVSSTTRKPRTYEEEGREYFFLSDEEFDRRITDGLFLEHAVFAGNRYGTELRNLENAERSGKHLVLDIEIQGVIQLKKSHPERVVVVFICPPSLEILRERFMQRGTDSPERISERIEIAKLEIKKALEPGFSDYVIVNHALSESILYSRSLVLGETVRRERIDQSFLEPCKFS